MTTIKCKSCGARWPVTEDMPRAEKRIIKTDAYRCASCGAAAVFEVNLSEIERRQG